MTSVQFASGLFGFMMLGCGMSFLFQGISDAFNHPFKTTPHLAPHKAYVEIAIAIAFFIASGVVWR